MDPVPDRLLGNVLGAAVGDALGCPFEFQQRKIVVERLGDPPWIDDLHQARGLGIHPLGVWQEDPPLGVGTDDTRLNRLFLDLVSDRGPAISGHDLAARYLRAYRHPDADLPHGLPADRQGVLRDLWRDNIAFLLDAACGRLGVPSPLHPQAPRDALCSGALGLGIPILIGLISLPSCGCLCPGDPVGAYKRAFDLAFVDLGLARDLTAVQAAMVALLVAGVPLREALREGLSINPYGASTASRDRIRSWLEEAGRAPDDRAFCDFLARESRHFHPFDALLALGTALCCLCRAGGDFRRAVLLSVNQWELGDDEKPSRLRDVDCYGSITGALCGAAAGKSGIPPAWLFACMNGNQKAYGFDMLDAAQRFAQAVVDSARPWPPSPSRNSERTNPPHQGG